MKLEPRYIKREVIRFLTFLIVFHLLGSLSLSHAKENIKPKKEDYNVLLIIIDTLRPDHLGCYGYPKDTSLTIDKIAKDSVLFENAFSNAGYTLPSTMSILTSLYPSSHGMKVIYKDKLSPRVQTMAEILQAYEYQTAWFSLLKEPHLDIDIGFGRGFQDKVELSLQFEGREKLLDWLKTNQEKKFFLAVDARQVHDHLWLQQSKALKGVSEQNAKEMYDEINGQEKFYYNKLREFVRSRIPPFDDPMLIADNPELFNGIYIAGKVEQIKALVGAQQWDAITGNFYGAWPYKKVKRR